MVRSSNALLDFTMLRRGACLWNGGSRRMGPTITVKATKNNDLDQEKPALQLITWKDRIIRPLTEDEENYEVMRSKKNSGSNLQIRGKHKVQINRRSESRTDSYDAY